MEAASEAVIGHRLDTRKTAVCDIQTVTGGNQMKGFSPLRDHQTDVLCVRCNIFWIPGDPPSLPPLALSPQMAPKTKEPSPA
ncbi:hypothetical protein VZT92_003614 [Zoarces viviparus]|uniref:Uncharacterized protein n=1 Tax=Zoarces viviparus TaxID=48416 RepID=A0AAW1FU00_ZOAVI